MPKSEPMPYAQWNAGKKMRSAGKNFQPFYCAI